MTTSHRPRVLVAAWVAAGLGLASAAVSAYWAFGGTGLLDTIGGELERWGRERSASAVIALLIIAVVKTVVALAAPVYVGVGKHRLPSWATGRTTRVMGWVAAYTLIMYGGYLTVGGLLVKGGVIDIEAGGDSKAFTWHAYFWDPWFVVWGLALGACLWFTRPEHNRPSWLARL